MERYAGEGYDCESVILAKTWILQNMYQKWKAVHKRLQVFQTQESDTSFVNDYQSNTLYGQNSVPKLLTDQ